MTGEPDDATKRAIELEVLKKKVEELEREIAELRADPFAREAVEQAYREWERRHPAKEDDEGTDPEGELVKLLRLAALKKDLQDAKEGRTEEFRPAVPRFPDRPLPDRIILLVSSYEDMGSGMHLADGDIAYLLQTDLEETRKEMLNLEGKGLLNLKGEERPSSSCGARLTTAGIARAAWLKPPPTPKTSTDPRSRHQPRIMISTASGFTPNVSARAFFASAIVSFPVPEDGGRSCACGSLIDGMG